MKYFPSEVEVQFLMYISPTQPTNYANYRASKFNIALFDSIMYASKEDIDVISSVWPEHVQAVNNHRTVPMYLDKIREGYKNS